MVPSPEQPLTANASQVIEQNLRVARQVKASTANLDASEVAAAVQDPTVWSNLVHASLTTLLTQKALYDLLAPTISPERAKDLETLRTANECALESVRSIKHSDKVREAQLGRAIIALDQAC
jgi:hypothetical protein